MKNWNDTIWPVTTWELVKLFLTCFFVGLLTAAVPCALIHYLG